jgi:hypothetical protein
MTEKGVGQDVKHPSTNFVIRVVYQTLYKKLLLPSVLLLVGGDLMYFVACIFLFTILTFFFYTFSVLRIRYCPSVVSAWPHKIVYKDFANIFSLVFLFKKC